MPHPTKPDIDIKIVDVSMNNLDIGTIWFKDGIFSTRQKVLFQPVDCLFNTQQIYLV